MTFDQRMTLAPRRLDDVAIITADQGDRITYRELRRRTDAFAASLSHARGLLLLIADNSLDALIAYLGGLSARCPVVLLDASARHMIDRCRAQFTVRHLFDPADGGLRVFDDAAAIPLHPDLAVMMSTSGSTGAQKFVRLSFANLHSNAAAIADYLALSRTDRAPTGLSMSYSYGLSVINSHLFAGASLLQTQTPMLDERFWVDFNNVDCTSFSGVPQHFAMLETAGLLDRPGPALRYVTQAGGRLPPDTVRAMVERGRAAGWRFYVMYGQTEASPRIAYLPPALAHSHPGSIGKAIPGGRITLLDEAGAVIDGPGQEGRLIYEGPNVMMGYASADADLANPAGPPRLETGDLAMRDEDGLFTITGRAARFVKVVGKRISLDSLERRLEEAGVAGIAVGRDDAIGLVLEKGEDDDGLRRRLSDELGVPASALTLIPVETTPLTRNGKVDYPAALALLDIALARPKPTVKERTRRKSTAAHVLAAYQAQFPSQTVRPDDSFQSLEGSSIDFVDLELRLGETGSAPPEGWHRLTITALADGMASSAAEASPANTTIFDPVAARGLCLVLVVLLHVIGSSPSEGLRLAANAPLAAAADMLRFITLPLFTFLAGVAFDVADRAALTPQRFVVTTLRTLVVPTAVTLVGFVLLATAAGTQFAIASPGEALALLVFPYAHFWFIMALVVMSALAYGLTRAPQRWRAPIMIVVIALLLTAHLDAPWNVWAINSVLLFFPYFALGFAFSRYAQTMRRHAFALTLIALALAALALPFALEHRVAEGSPWSPRSWPGFVFGAALIFLSLRYAQSLPWVRRLAPCSLAIYLWHVFATAPVRRALDAAGVHEPFWHLAIGVTAGLLVPIALYAVLDRAPFGHLLLGRAPPAAQRSTP